jgi:hypothetical protein
MVKKFPVFYGDKMFTRARIVRGSVLYFNTMVLKAGNYPPAKPQAGGPPVVGCPLLFYSIYPQLHSAGGVLLGDSGPT